LAGAPTETEALFATSQQGEAELVGVLGQQPSNRLARRGDRRVRRPSGTAASPRVSVVGHGGGVPASQRRSRPQRSSSPQQFASVPFMHEVPTIPLRSDAIRTGTERHVNEWSVLIEVG